MMPIVQLTFPTADSTGTHSLYTTFKDYELMFHVSTLLPYTPNNKQQVRMDGSTRRPSAGKDARLDVHIINVCSVPLMGAPCSLTTSC